jgi:iron-sulfur cluster assembly protein
MLTLTDNASTVVKTIIARTESVVDGGLRIHPGADGAGDFAVTVTPIPADGDQVVETDGARVYLEQNVAAVLDDKVLDAEVGENGTVTFALLPQV